MTLDNHIDKFRWMELKPDIEEEYFKLSYSILGSEPLRINKLSRLISWVFGGIV